MIPPSPKYFDEKENGMKWLKLTKVANVAIKNRMKKKKINCVISKPSLLPIQDQALIGCLFVTDRADPGGLLLIHLKIKSSIKTLQVSASNSPAWDCQSHFSQLQERHLKNVRRQ